MKNANNLVWIDLEMTGLYPQTDVILEIATIITDDNLNPLAPSLSLVIHQPDSILENMNEWCKHQHALSDLTAEVKKSTTTLEQAQVETLSLIAQFCPPKKGILCGNSIWQDQKFLERYMPNISAYLHYKMIDVTSIQQLIKRWYPDDPNISFLKTEEHRALPDILESIDELKHYRKYFFI
ncbi:MAG: oligoribonuclease [Candidatus Babeliales bacterium]